MIRESTKNLWTQHGPTGEADFDSRGTAKREQWRSLDEVRKAYPSTDQVGQCLVFNVRGNHYRLIVGVKYATPEHGGTLFIKHFLTHAEYDQDQWKKDCSCQ